MIVIEFGESVVLGLWVLVLVVYLVLGMSDNDVSKPNSGASASPRSGRGNGFIPSSFRAISSYLRIVSSGASTVARSAASVASSIVDRDDESSRDQVLWAGFDKLESEGEIRRVLLLAYRSGFQVWDVEEADNVRDLVSRNDGPVSFMQMVPNPAPMKKVDDKFVESRPLLVICTDCSGGTNYQDGFTTQCNGNIPSWNDQGNGCFVPTAVRFYSLKSQSCVHVLKFRSAVYSVRCSSQVVAISQASQIHCFDATMLERVYTILTNPISSGSPGSGGVGYGPLAVGPRWVAYSGAPVLGSDPGRVTPQHLTPSASLPSYPSNGSLVAHYAKESSKQLAAGIVTLGDMGYKKLSRYCSERLSDSNNSPQSVNAGGKGSGVINGHVQEADNVGVVVVRDFISKSVVVQFRAHKSPISALCFDPSGTLLVTASIQGHNINVFKIMPGLSGSASTSDAGDAIHLYRLQRGVTNAVIQDISFSDDSNWIMVSSSRGTSHLFSLCPYGGLANFQAADSFTARNNGLSFVNKTSVRWLHNSDTQIDTIQGLCAKGSPVTLSAISRIRNGNGWRGTVSGAAAAATGRGNFLSGAIASSFHKCKGNVSFADKSYLKAKYHLLVFSPSGSMIQYALRIVGGQDSLSIMAGSNACEAESDSDGRLVVDAIQKWNVSQKQNRREREENFDIYGENGNVDTKRIYPEGMMKGNCFAPGAGDVSSKPRMSSEERNHFCISQAESQVHQAQIPLWAKPGIYFQSILEEGMKSEESSFWGEMEIETMANCMIEARPKILVPVFDYLQTSKSQHTRVPVVIGNVGHQYSKSGLSARGTVFDVCSPSPLESTTDIGAAAEELNCGFKESASNGHLMPKESKLVNSSGCTDIEREFVDVNNRESLGEETPIKYVKSNEKALKRENHFQEEGSDELG